MQDRCDIIVIWLSIITLVTIWLAQDGWKYDAALYVGLYIGTQVSLAVYPLLSKGEKCTSTK